MYGSDRQCFQTYIVINFSMHPTLTLILDNGFKIRCVVLLLLRWSLHIPALDLELLALSLQMLHTWITSLFKSFYPWIATLFCLCTIHFHLFNLVLRRFHLCCINRTNSSEMWALRARPSRPHQSYHCLASFSLGRRLAVLFSNWCWWRTPMAWTDDGGEVMCRLIWCVDRWPTCPTERWDESGKRCNFLCVGITEKWAWPYFSRLHEDDRDSDFPPPPTTASVILPPAPVFLLVSTNPA